MSQGVGVATGLQGKFSWADVAAAGVAAGVGQDLSERFGVSDLTTAAGRTPGNIAAQTAVSAATLSAIYSL